MFVMFHGTNGIAEVGISVGMRKGRYGIVKAYAKEFPGTDQPGGLHARDAARARRHRQVRALDRRSDLSGWICRSRTSSPLVPTDAVRRSWAGPFPCTPDSSAMPKSLEQCKIGRLTAEEIGFFDKLNSHVDRA